MIRRTLLVGLLILSSCYPVAGTTPWPTRAVQMAAVTSKVLRVLLTTPPPVPATLTLVRDDAPLHLARRGITVAAVRNVVGYTGLAMIGVRVFGSGLAWLPPLAMFGPTLLAGVRWDNTPEPWAWSIHGPHSVTAAVTAAVLCAVGLPLAATTTPRRTERDEQG